jgi:hypothetical protein
MTAVIFPDGQLAVRNALRAALAARPEPVTTGVTVSTRVPAGTEVPPLPYVLVRLDGNSRNARLLSEATVRVTVWHRDEGLALELAGLAEALLLGGLARVPEIRSVGPVASPIPTTDPDSGAPIAFFRVAARMRPRTLTP